MMKIMNINYRNNNIVEAECVNGHEVITVVCPVCGAVWQLEDGDIILEPWPRFECPHCGEWIPLF